MNKYCKLIGVTLLLGLAGGCATKHYQENAISNNEFKGDSSLSLGGNLELLAGNDKVETRNRDEAVDGNDAFYLKQAGNYPSAAANDAIRTASLALTAKYMLSGVAVTELLSNPADYPDGQVVILVKSAGEDPHSEAMLRKAWEQLTNPNAPKVKETTCQMDDDSLFCKKGDSNVGELHFTSAVDFDFVKKLNPNATPGHYVAYGFKPSLWTLAGFTDKDYGRENNPNTFYFNPGKCWYSAASQGKYDLVITYHVSEVNAPNLKTVVYIHNDKYKDGKIAEFR